MSRMSGGTGGSIWDRERLVAPHGHTDKAWRVRTMFDAIAPTYELINTLASAGQDRFWRREMVRLAGVRSDDVLLDVACGTGDVVRVFAAGDRHGVRPSLILGVDFSTNMLRFAADRSGNAARAEARGSSSGEREAAFLKADALRLPIADHAVSIVTCAFGIRNFQDLDVGLGEMYRVLCPGGRAVILEFGVPTRPVLRHLYLCYATRLMPMLAAWISRDHTGAYRYLPRSVLSFPGSKMIASRLQAAGFSRVSVHPLSWGIVAIHVAAKEGPAPPRGTGVNENPGSHS